METGKEPKPGFSERLFRAKVEVVFAEIPGMSRQIVADRYCPENVYVLEVTKKG